MATKKTTTSAPRRRPLIPRSRVRRLLPEDLQREQELLDAARANPPERVLNLRTYPTRLRQNSIVVHCDHLGNPGIKRRGRFNPATGNVYSPTLNRLQQRDVGWTVRSAMRELLLDADSAFGVRLIFYVEDGRRKDIDNMIKLVFDGLTGIVWKDDSQVKELFSWVIEDPAHPRTEMCIYRLDFSAKRIERCEICQRVFQILGPRSFKRFCSRTCAAFSRRNRILTTCAHCGTNIERRPDVFRENRTYFCSQACKTAHLTAECICSYCGGPFQRLLSALKGKSAIYCSQECRGHAWGDARISPAVGICQCCGGPTTNKKYIRCMGCRLLRRSPAAS